MARFMRFVSKEPTSGCWLWTGSVSPKGYGGFGGGTYGKRAHRVSWRLFRGTIPDGFDVCHKCDTPPCVNPDHLFVGTRSDNMYDCSRKGRLYRGGMSYLTHCKRGHKLGGDNVFGGGDGHGWRRCRACQNLGFRRRRALKRQERTAAQ
jgi:hypothetical protein